MDDWRLVRRYVDDGSDAAFAELTERHLKLVYWTCRRDLTDCQMAEDATQVVFVLLARKARTFRRGVNLASWLFKTARFVARDALKRETHRRRFEVQGVADMDLRASRVDDWRTIEPWLNDALDALPEADRTAVLLRYFDGLSLQEVADQTHTSVEAARKRVSRAVDRMRVFLQRKDVAVTGMVLAALLGARASEAVPESIRALTLSQSHHVAAAGHSAVPAGGPAAQILQGVNTTMQATTRKLAIATIAAVAGITLPVAIIKAQSAPHDSGTYVDSTAAAPATASVDPGYSAAHSEISGDYAEMVSMYVRRDPQWMSRYAGPSFSLSLLSKVVPSQSAAQVADDTQKNDFDGTKSFTVDMMLQSLSVTGDNATANIRVHFDANGNGRGNIPTDGHLVADQSYSVHWAKVNGRWLMGQNDQITNTTTLNGQAVP